MSDLKNAILDAKYIDMIELGDFVVRDCGLPDVDSDGNLMPQATEIAAALFRWAADVQAAEAKKSAEPEENTSEPEEKTSETAAADDKPPFREFDENGDPLMDAAEAERLETEMKQQEQEST